jgi:group I intron endonuclease
MKFGFVYLWYDIKNKKFYLGSHLGQPTDGYTGSNRRFQSAIKSRPDSFKRRILESYEKITSKELLKREEYWLKMIKPEELTVRYYNEKTVASGGDIISGLTEEKKKQHSEKSRAASRKYWDNITPEDYEKRRKNAFGGNKFDRSYMKDPENRLKLSIKMTGEKNPFYGKKHSDEFKMKMSEKMKNKIPWIKGKKHSVQTKNLVKMNNPKRKTFITPEGKFLSGEDYAKITNKLTSNGIRNILKERFKPLTKMRIERSKIFNIEDLGKTPFEIGYRYENEI